MARRFSFDHIARANDEFNLATGVAAGRWSHIEAGFCLWFKKITKMPHGMARAVFYSVSGFDGRRRMFQAAIGQAKMPEELRGYLNFLASKAGNYSSSRNMMAHDARRVVGISQAGGVGVLASSEGSAISEIL
jgi:hypothetical protein